MAKVLVCIDYKGWAEIIPVDDLADAVRKAVKLDGCDKIIYGVELAKEHLETQSLTEEEKHILLQVYRFQRERSFRYGLRKEYIKHLDTEALENLREKGLVWVLRRRYGDKIYDYVFLTRHGRRIAELLYELNVFSREEQFL